MAKALEGIKILDLSQFEAGPSCTEQLAFLGADVVKIEPTGGEVGRTFLKTKEDKTGFDSWYFLSLNANKRGITLNLKSPKGIAMFKDMVKKADVVVSNFEPGVMEKMGLGYDVLSKINPKLVYAVNTGFGEGGPYSNYLSMDACAKAIGGSFSNTGLLETPPLNPGPTIGDTGAGMHLGIGILAAYIHAQKTGEGQYVEQSMADAIINFNRVPTSIHPLDSGEPHPRRDSSDAVKCKGDGPNDYAFVNLLTPKQYEMAMKAIGREDMITDELKYDIWARKDKWNEIKDAIEGWTQTKDKMEVFHNPARGGGPLRTGP